MWNFLLSTSYKDHKTYIVSNIDITLVTKEKIHNVYLSLGCYMDGTTVILKSWNNI